MVFNKYFNMLKKFFCDKKTRRALLDYFTLLDSENKIEINKNNHSYIFSVLNKYDGRVYLPLYNLNYPLKSCNYNVYNKDGNLLKPIYYRNFHTSHSVNISTNYCLFDMYNYSLDTHFYFNNCMLEQSGKPIKKYGALIESRDIVPDEYEIFNKYPSLNSEFEKIFTFDEKILDSVENACFVPFSATPRYGNSLFSGGGYGSEMLDGSIYCRKNKIISMVCSDKISTKMHKLRVELARYCKRNNLLDTYGTFDGGKYCNIEDYLKDYRYTIIIENHLGSYYFSEKIANCFASMTIPIYLGASKIGDFFNTDGVIKLTLEDLDNIESVLSQCTIEGYNERIEAVKDNYNRILNYLNVFDEFIYKKYLKG